MAHEPLVIAGMILWPLAIGAIGVAGYAFLFAEKPSTMKSAETPTQASMRILDKRSDHTKEQTENIGKEKLKLSSPPPREETKIDPSSFGSQNLTSADSNKEIKRENNNNSAIPSRKPDPLVIYKCFGMISILNDTYGPNEVMTYKLAFSVTIASKILEESGVPPNGITQYMNNLIQFERKKTVSLMQAGVNFSADADICISEFDMALDYGRTVLGLGR